MRGAPEATIEAVTASRDQLASDYPNWNIPLPAGAEDLGHPDRGVRLIWKATHPDWPDCYGGAAHELRTKIANVEAQWAKDADQMKRFMDGRGVQRKVIR